MTLVGAAMGCILLFAVTFLLQVSLAGANPDDPWVQQRVAIQFVVSLGMSNPNIFWHIINSFDPAAYC